MEKKEIREKIELIIEDKIGIERIDMREDDTHLENDLGFDSLDKVEVIMEVEKEFNIAIDDYKAENVKTIGEFVELVEKALA